MTEKSINIKKLLRFSGKNKTIKPVPTTKGHDYVGLTALGTTVFRFDVVGIF